MKNSLKTMVCCDKITLLALTIFRGSSMVERLPVKEMVPGSSPGRGGGYSGVFRPASVLNSIKTPDSIWGFDFHSSAPECTFCLTTVWFRPNFCYDKKI